MHQRRNLGARLLEKTEKDRHLRQKSNPRNQQNAKRIYQPLRHHRPQGLCKGNIIIFGKYSTTRNLSHTGQYQIGGIRYKNGINAIACFGMSIQRLQSLLPTPAS